jgi:hypothetical protein
MYLISFLFQRSGHRGGVKKPRPGRQSNKSRKARLAKAQGSNNQIKAKYLVIENC